MRFLSAPWTGILRDGAWLKHARNANKMAKRLGAGLSKLPQVKISFPVESNAVFAKIPPNAEKKMHKRGWKFYTGVVTPEESRLMCSWDTTETDVDTFVSDLRNCL